MAVVGANPGSSIKTTVPARLDRLPWARFHLMVVVALGITWVLDGLEVTIVGALSGILQSEHTLHLSSEQIGTVASCYITGAVFGAVVFGWLTDRFGRRTMFYITLAIYLGGVLLTAVSWGMASFAIFRLITGLGIGGEYAAINSAIDELIPARLRGRTDLIVNGSYWIGAGIGAAATILLLNPSLLPVDLGWRLGFGIGGVLGLGILILRRHVPESPRWLVTHGYEKDAEKVVSGIEAAVRKEAHRRSLSEPGEPLTIHPRKTFGFGLIAEAIIAKYRARSALALSLMVAQAFLYNAVFFTYGLVLTRFYGVSAGRIGLYIMPLAIGNFMGPLLLGHFFDTIGRRRMISATFGLAGMLLIITAVLFATGRLSDVSQTAAWTIIFFFASAASSSAYLTASEIFPLETRALAIAVFYAAGTAIGGIVAPWLFGTLIGTGSRWNVFFGYCGAALLMLAAAAMERRFGVDAEGRSLEQIAEPLSG
ncbi:MAG: MFS transporter [Alphaproteobacteria bacterium]|nr:MFS transporter [Alphaproteobacteria bacterium]